MRSIDSEGHSCVGFICSAVDFSREMAIQNLPRVY